MLTLRGDTDQITGKADSAGNELEISGFYGDHAVFQHGKSFIIRGKAQVQVKVELFIAGVHLAVFANDYGEFSFRVPPLAPARNLELTVIAGGSKIVFHDIAIGNVYIAGGQSNMEFAMKNAIPSVELLDGCDLSGIRCFALPVKTNLGIAGAVDGAWQCASKDQLAGFSALAGFFAAPERLANAKQREKLLAAREQLERNQKLVALRTAWPEELETPEKVLVKREPDWQKIAEMARDYELKSVLRDLPVKIELSAPVEKAPAPAADDLFAWSAPAEKAEEKAPEKTENRPAQGTLF